jgi:autotransporter-associated beta strand protein
MTKNCLHAANNRLSFRAGLLASAAVLWWGSAGSLMGQVTWNGGGADNNWGTASNWSGGVAPVSGNAVVFSGTTKQTNTNNISGLTLAGVTISTAGWNISGNAISMSGNITNNVAGSNIWAINTTFNSTPSILQSASGDILNFTGALSGTGGILKTPGSTAQGVVHLSNTNNSFTGAVSFESGYMYFYSMAPGGQNSSFGSGSGTITVGPNDSSYQAYLAFLGTTNCSTTRAFIFQHNPATATSFITFSNNSPNNSSLTFDGNWTVQTGSANGVNPWNLRLGGISTGTNYVMGNIGTGTQPQNLVTLTVYGPGGWVFGGSVNNIPGNESITNSAKVTILNNQIIVAPTIFVASGSTLDVSYNDTNDMSPYEIGVNGAQTLQAGHVGSATGSDIIGSVALEQNAILNVAGSGVAGTLTLSSNFVPGYGSIAFDLSTNVTVGSGSNDLILVKGNLDLSQGTTTINTKALFTNGIATNTPYTLIAYTGSLIGNASGLNVVAPSVAYNPGIVSVATPGVIQVSFTASGSGPATLDFSGDFGGNWDVATTPNWFYTNGMAQEYFYNGDSVIFNDNSYNFSVNIVGDVSPGTMLVSNSQNGYTFSSSSGGFIDSGSLTKQGTQELTLMTANTYAGNTVLSAGTISAGANTACGAGSITLGDSSTGTNEVILLINSSAVLANPVTVTSNGTGGVMIGRESGGTATFNGTITLNQNVIFSNMATFNTALQLYGLAGTGNVTAAGGGKHLWSGPFTFAGSISMLQGNGNYPTILQLQASAPSNTMDVGTNTILEVEPSVTIDALNGAGFITTAANNSVVSETLTLGANGGSGVFTGMISNIIYYQGGGSTALNLAGSTVNIVKTGAGTEVFTGDNSGTGGTTTISDGVLEVDNTNGYGLGTGAVTVSAGGVLDGDGIIYTSNGSVTISGTLAVGDAGHTNGASFTFTNTAGMTVNSNGAFSVNLYSGAGAGNNTANTNAADILVAQCPVTLNSGAVLEVGNPAGMTAWAAGDQWTIANWSSTPTNTFTTLNLPALPGNLAWTVSNLYNAGVIGIVSNTAGPTEPAEILSVSVSGDNLVVTGTNENGGASFHYLILSSTNLALPVSKWTILSTNGFNANGTFAFTNSISASQPSTFFTVKAVQ